MSKAFQVWKKIGWKVATWLMDQWLNMTHYIDPYNTAYPKNMSVSTPNNLRPYFQIFSQIFWQTHHPSVKTTECQRSIFLFLSFILEEQCVNSHLQIHWRTTLGQFCSHLWTSFSIKLKDCRTLSTKKMHYVCCFCWCRRVVSWMVVVWFRAFFFSFMQSLITNNFEFKPAI